MNTEEIKKISRAKYLHTLAKINLRERIEAKLIVTLGDGSWRVTPELLAFLSVYDKESVILMDMYDNPVRVNARELFDLAKHTYDTAMETWLRENDAIMKQR